MPLHAILAALLVAICWGGNFTATKFALAAFPPFLTVLLRFVAVTVILAPFAARQKMPRLRDMLVIGLLLIVIQFTLIFTAMAQGLSITSTIIATQMGVPFSCVAAAILFKDYLGPWRSFGLMVAFFGILMVAGTPNAAGHWGSFMLAVLASCSWGSANIYMKRMPPQPVVTLLFWPGLLSLPFLAFISALVEHGQLAAIQNAPWSAWTGISYSMLFSSLIGYGLWNWLLTKYPLTQVVPYSLCVPIVGITGGVLVFGEPLNWQIITGAALTILGVAVITLRRPKLAELEAA